MKVYGSRLSVVQLASLATIAVFSIALVAPVRGERRVPARGEDPAAVEVELFSAMESGDIEVQVFAKDAKQADDEADGHLFLDPANAKAMARSIAATLVRADAANAARYEANAASLLTRLDALDAELRAILVPARERPYLVFHDAYQYFEKRYGLEAAGSITVTPDRRPGARRLAALRKRVASVEALCVFSEPQFEPSLVETVSEGTKARTGVLDPLGADLTPGPDAYFAMMRNLAKAFAGCLAG